MTPPPFVAIVSLSTRSKVDFSTSCILGAVLGVASWAAVLHGL